MKKLNKLAKRALKGGFSLVEMLVVIAVIGVITAIAVPAISSITSEAETAKIQRNAQNIASVYNAAVAAGAASTGVSDVSSAIDWLQTGTNGSGSFVNASFKVDISEAEQTAVETEGYLTYDATNNIMSLLIP